MIKLEEAEFVAGTVDGSVRVLHPITLNLSERRIALIGANGSGKSTLARMLNGLIEPSAGRVLVGDAKSGSEVDVGAGDATGAGGAGGAQVEAGAARPGRVRAAGSGGVDGQPRVGVLPDSAGVSPEGDADIARWLDTRRDGAAVRRLVGFVFTDPSSQLVMPTALEDVALSLRRLHPGKAARVAAARDALARFGLDELADRSVHSLSGGQQQLLAIAGVLAAGPAILVADEPTTLLDLRNGRLMSELLLELPQQVIIATHDLELAARCDRVIVIADGAVAFDSVSETSAPETSVSEVGVPETRVPEASVSESRAVDVTAAGVSATDGNATDVGAMEVSAVEVGAAAIRTPAGAVAWYREHA